MILIELSVKTKVLNRIYGPFWNQKIYFFYYLDRKIYKLSGILLARNCEKN